MARDEYLKHLASIPLFAECDKKELVEIGKLATEIEIPAGREFIKEGEFAQEMIVIIEGTATVTRGGEKIATLGSGDVVGELALLQHRPRNATVTADTKLDILVIDSGAMDALLDDIPGLAKHLLKTVASRLADPA
jgi:CRP/FNR family transcriptional regulator, cyclic AMP receptor protein